MLKRLSFAFAVLWLVLLVVGHFVDFPAWLWIVVLLMAILLIIADRLTRERKTLH